MWESKLTPEKDLSSYVLLFLLSFVIKKCYDYAPLTMLADNFVPYISDKVWYFMEFQVIFLPYGYSHHLHSKYLNKKVMPHHHSILRWNS